MCLPPPTILQYIDNILRYPTILQYPRATIYIKGAGKQKCLRPQSKWFVLGLLEPGFSTLQWMEYYYNLVESR